MSEPGNGRYKARRRATRSSRGDRSASTRSTPAETTPPSPPEPPRYAPRDESPFWASAQTAGASNQSPFWANAQTGSGQSPLPAPSGLGATPSRPNIQSGLGTTGQSSRQSPSWTTQSTAAEPEADTPSTGRRFLGRSQPAAEALADAGAEATTSSRVGARRARTRDSASTSAGRGAAGGAAAAGATVSRAAGDAAAAGASAGRAAGGAPAAGASADGAAAGFGAAASGSGATASATRSGVGSYADSPAYSARTTEGTAYSSDLGRSSADRLGHPGGDKLGSPDKLGHPGGDRLGRSDADVVARSGAAGTAARSGSTGPGRSSSGGGGSRPGSRAAGRSGDGGGSGTRTKRTLIAIASVVVVITPISWILLHEPQNDTADASLPMVTRTDDTYVTPTTKPVVNTPKPKSSPTPSATPTTTPTTTPTGTPSPTPTGTGSPTDYPTTVPTDGPTAPPTAPPTEQRPTTSPTPSKTPTTTTPPAPVDDGSMTSDELQLFNLINNERVDNGCAKLKRKTSLTTGARSEAADRAESGNVNSSNDEESTAGGDDWTAQQAFDRMMSQSESTILDCSLTTLGVGRADAEYKSGLCPLLFCSTKTRVAWVADFT